MSRIPDRSRDLVRLRARHRCERCGTPAPSGAWHHRRRRAVVDVHTHCPCNGLWLCWTCHRQVHDGPVAAREHGWIVSPWNPQPATTPVRTHLGWGFHDCEGTFAFVTTQEQPPGATT